MSSLSDARAELVRRGLKHGIPQDRLDRMTTVVLKKLLTHDKPSSVRSSEAKKKETKERISEDRLRSRPSGPDDDDRHEDNQTVVDLAYAEEAANPADRKSVASGKSVDLGGRRIIKKKNTTYSLLISTMSRPSNTSHVL